MRTSTAFTLFLVLLLPTVASIDGRAQGLPLPSGVYAQSAATLAGRAGYTANEPIKCGLAITAAAERDRPSLSSAEAEALRVLDTRPLHQTSVLSNGFRIHFDTTGANAPALLNDQHQRIPGTSYAYVDSVASMLAYVAAYESSVLGFLAPPPDDTLGGGPEYDIYIEELGNLYGLTTPDRATAEGETSPTFIVIDNDFIFVFPDSLKGLPGLRVTLAHEYHHAIQIGRYGYRINDLWYHEITSVWMEDVVYTGVNDYYSYLRSFDSQFRTPEVPLTSNDYIMYSRGIWGQYFSKQYGSNAMLLTWQGIGASPPVTAIDNVLHAYFQSNLRAAFAQWCLWNHFTGPRADPVLYYPEGAHFPSMVKLQYDLTVSPRQISSNVGCLGSRYFVIGAGTDTLSVIVVYTGTGCTLPGPTIPFTLYVARSRLDDAYNGASGGFFIKLSASDPTQWVLWDAATKGPVGPTVVEGGSFPNPFRPGAGQVVYFPSVMTAATVSVYTTDMELVYSGYQSSQTYLGRRVFTWNGASHSGEIAPTGIYVFVLQGGEKTVTGKFALVRQ
ncbi:MAG: MXAN_6640 family putative metalloprotease [Bacteroidota bacterium]